MEEEEEEGGSSVVKGNEWDSSVWLVRRNGRRKTGYVYLSSFVQLRMYVCVWTDDGVIWGKGRV